MLLTARDLVIERGPAVPPVRAGEHVAAVVADLPALSPADAVVVLPFGVPTQDSYGVAVQGDGAVAGRGFGWAFVEQGHCVL
ncbi:hypothetical protein GCM10022225_79370 [Plantactinospora mayteni]|uniref:Uncharacterized protein n=1 Tax=Plantactinospora mayteni TaxID=566021 RepID=A0ABQ4F3A5_9ACTN|nr:hypothetical protein [Plantactinospora mayteni]GIH01393.1 hypothetical protein Pma05_79650 [Plantactinospora mayteni]